MTGSFKTPRPSGRELSPSPPTPEPLEEAFEPISPPNFDLETLPRPDINETPDQECVRLRAQNQLWATEYVRLEEYTRQLKVKTERALNDARSGQRFWHDRIRAAEEFVNELTFKNKKWYDDYKDLVRAMKDLKAKNQKWYEKFGPLSTEQKDGTEGQDAVGSTEEPLPSASASDLQSVGVLNDTARTKGDGGAQALKIASTPQQQLHAQTNGKRAFTESAISPDDPKLLKKAKHDQTSEQPGKAAAADSSGEMPAPERSLNSKIEVTMARERRHYIHWMSNAGFPVHAVDFQVLVLKPLRGSPMQAIARRDRSYFRSKVTYHVTMSIISSLIKVHAALQRNKNAVSSIPRHEPYCLQCVASGVLTKWTYGTTHACEDCITHNRYCFSQVPEDKLKKVVILLPIAEELRLGDAKEGEIPYYRTPME